ncbi:MAG: endonuclease [Deltaproteobacteria bacterium RIFCSPLOWO2_12_FULL_50_11]|nr:MAG: endonuclease [Deltaproteobacteria bacterium RIFCSPLOWO2_12_FULL_50_11]
MPSPLQKVYHHLYKSMGSQHWWPGETPFEVCVGAILTQNTNWTNVEKAISNLKKAHLLTPQRLHQLDHQRLAQLIRPAGYFNIKAKRLAAFLDYLMEAYEGDLGLMFQKSLTGLREELLAVKGIGPETADSILLYAGNKSVFVVDAYTRRIFLRHGWIGEDFDYAAIQEYCMEALPADRVLFNEFHALMVRVGKDYCRPRPRCETCPLKSFLPEGGIQGGF